MNNYIDYLKQIIELQNKTIAKQMKGGQNK